MAESDLDTLIAFAAQLADAAGAVTRRLFRTPMAIDDKPDASPVTAADRETEAAMRTLIEARFPDHGIIGEEFPPLRPEADHLWLLDPIDGTKSFVGGVPLFGTLIALLREGRPLLGVIDHAVLGDRWLGARGRGTAWNGRPVTTRPCPGLGGAVLHATSPEMFAAGEAAAFARVRARAALTVYGAECYAYGLLAAGFVDLIVEATLGPDDYLPLAAVVEGAGGVMSDWRGAPLDLHSDGRVVAAGDARLHAQALDLLAG